MYSSTVLDVEYYCVRAEIPREGVKVAAATPASDEELAWAFLTLAAYTNMKQFRLTLMGGEAAGRWATAEYIKTGLGNPLRSKGFKLCQFNFRRRYIIATDEEDLDLP